MGLFDRIRGGDEEVEIKPPERRGYDYRDTDSRDEEDDTGDEFVLPGMKPASTDSSSSSSKSSGSAAPGRSRRDGVDRLIEQNDRIIELLEELTGSETGTDSVL